MLSSTCTPFDDSAVKIDVEAPVRIFPVDCDLGTCLGGRATAVPQALPLLGLTLPLLLQAARQPDVLPFPLTLDLVLLSLDILPALP